LEAGWVVTDSRTTLRRKVSEKHVLGVEEGDDESGGGEFAISQRERAELDWEHHDKRERDLAEMNS